MLEFEFYVIFTCHETIVFSDLFSTVLKSLLGADIFVTPLSRQGGQTWGEASSWAGSSLEQLNSGQARAVETCTGAQTGKNRLLPEHMDKWRCYQAQKWKPARSGSGKVLWRIRGARPLRFRRLQNSWKIVFKIICSTRKRYESPRIGVALVRISQEESD